MALDLSSKERKLRKLDTEFTKFDDDQPLNLKTCRVELKRELPVDLTHSDAIDLTNCDSEDETVPPTTAPSRRPLRTEVSEPWVDSSTAGKSEPVEGAEQPIVRPRVPPWPAPPPEPGLGSSAPVPSGVPPPARTAPGMVAMETDELNADAGGRKRLGLYGTRDRSSTHGTGFVLILANFLYELPGYRIDIEGITRFFKGTLRYDVFGGSDCPEKDLHMFRNLSRSEMINTLASAQQQLSNPFSRLYDRVFVFILSHGDKDGIMTCKKINLSGRDTFTRETFDNNGRPIRVTEQEIVDMFTHDKIPTLFGYPKCFFFQNCRGNQVLDSAHGPIVQETGYIPPVAVGADTIMFHSATLGFLSVVSQTDGSWFIKETVSNLETYYLDETLVDIMHDVIATISRKREEVEHEGRGTCTNQLPCLVGSLTKKLYLTQPRAV